MKSAKEQNDLRGPVKTVRIETSEFKEEEGQRIEKPWYARSLAFDPEGNLTEEIHHNSDGSSFRTVYTYDAASGLLAEITHHDGSGAAVSKMVYEYDEEGRKIKEAAVKADNTREVLKTFTYNADGGYIEEQTFDESFFKEDVGIIYGIEGTESSYVVNGTHSIKVVRDAESKPREALFYDIGGVLLNRIVFTYDGEGKLIEETQHAGDVFPFGQCNVNAPAADITAAEEPQRHVPTEEELAEIAKMFAPGTPLLKQVYKYDERGRLIESAMMFADTLADKRDFVYDAAGHKVEEAYYDEDGSLRSTAIFTREYDAHGNWTKELVSSASTWDAEFNTSVPSVVHRRIITYYENPS